MAEQLLSLSAAGFEPALLLINFTRRVYLLHYRRGFNNIILYNNCQCSLKRIKHRVSYYEQKESWSLFSYIVRSRKGIEMLVNLINIAYCAMKLLPYQDETFSKYQNKSTQEIRFIFSERIRQEVFFAHLVENTLLTLPSFLWYNAFTIRI